MALGGGTFTTQNKKLPGTYINFVSAANASATLSDRGVATMAFELDWGEENKVFEVTNGDFQKNSQKIFGYAYSSDKLKGLRDLFLYTKTLYAYRLNAGGVKASNNYATAKYSGIRGNDLIIRIQPNTEDKTAFVVDTLLDGDVVDEQVVHAASDLVANDYVTFKADATLTTGAGIPLAGGTNGDVSGNAHQSYLNAIESYTYNTMGVVATDESTKTLYTSFVKRLRDEMGVKFQLVVYNKAADYMGTINVKNKVTDDGWSEASLVYWATGVSAGCEVNKTNQNKKYDGEFTIDTAYTQAQLEKCIDAGEWTLHQVGDDVRVLEDINSMVTVSDTCGEVFKDNQTVRVIDQIANDIAVLFNTKFMGTVPNDAAGRTSLWSSIVQYHEQLLDIRAIESFSDSDVTVEQGTSKKAVVVTDAITVVNAMDKLYMTVTVS